jgi:AbrB family looped-hinge helix DNA binding protein
MAATTTKTGNKHKSDTSSKSDIKRDSATGRLISRASKTGQRSTKVVAGCDPMPPKERGHVVKVSVDSAGRILVPAKLRKALDIEPGDDVNLELKGDVLQIRSLDDAINKAQALVRKCVPNKKSLVDELIAERRAEAERE